MNMTAETNFLSSNFFRETIDMCLKCYVLILGAHRPPVQVSVVGHGPEPVPEGGGGGGAHDPEHAQRAGAQPAHRAGPRAAQGSGTHRTAEHGTGFFSNTSHLARLAGHCISLESCALAGINYFFILCVLHCFLFLSFSEVWVSESEKLDLRLVLNILQFDKLLF